MGEDEGCCAIWDWELGRWGSKQWLLRHKVRRCASEVRSDLQCVSDEVPSWGAGLARLLDPEHVKGRVPAA